MPAHGIDSDSLSVTVSRRDALRRLSLASAAATGLGFTGSRSVTASQASSIPQTLPPKWFEPGKTLANHGQVIIGDGPIYLSHLPMFMFDIHNQQGQSTGSHPHHYQVILEGAFSGAGADDYLADRQQTGAPFYTLAPEAFHMLDLISPLPETTRLTSFMGSIVRGHFERPDEPQPFDIEWKELPDAVKVDVTRVIYAHEFSFRPTPPAHLEYILFGTGANLFLAHRIIMPPDFDQLLPVRLEGRTFPDAALQRGIIVTIPDRANALAERLMDGDTATGEARDAATGTLLATGFRVAPGQEFYFEEGELHYPAAFASTQAEIDAGFGFQ